ncbi:hypothetical protein P154DRAFT_254612 [Amniculicola lignicola CBS 123094]|uniref:Uncharacterized protein n=1 Tax=Amniculicola lignicola CBS 123094 TaxID=1392246 RepID=A0A6A5WYF3_9PLEO|nr:hypothetical protein P154DRAFT_254612 [Amniculicola lignicola CBS 123094]
MQLLAHTPADDYFLAPPLRLQFVWRLHLSAALGVLSAGADRQFPPIITPCTADCLGCDWTRTYVYASSSSTAGPAVLGGGEAPFSPAGDARHGCFCRGQPSLLAAVVVVRGVVGMVGWTRLRWSNFKNRSGQHAGTPRSTALNAKGTTRTIRHVSFVHRLCQRFGWILGLPSPRELAHRHVEGLLVRCMRVWQIRSPTTCEDAETLQGPSILEKPSLCTSFCCGRRVFHVRHNNVDGHIHFLASVGVSYHI